MMYSSERTRENYNLNLLGSTLLTGAFDIPQQKPGNCIPESLISFHNAFNWKRMRDSPGSFIHFFLDDYQFERVWKQPERYLHVLSAYAGVLSPDFSLYSNTPRALQIWNTYRNRTLSCWLQSKGVNVIPTVSWSDKRSFIYCFDGLPKGGTIALSVIGTQKNDYTKEMFRLGFEEFCRRCEPQHLLIYGENDVDCITKSGIQYSVFPNENIKKLKKITKDGRKGTIFAER